jgi:signal transduction histidine kinase
MYHVPSRLRSRPVALTFFLLFFTFAVTHGVRIAGRYVGYDQYDSFPLFFAVYAAFAILFGLLTLAKQSRRTDILLVGTIAMSSYPIAVLHSAENITAEILMVAAAAAGYRFRLFSRSTVPILTALFGGLVIVRIATDFGNGDINPFRLANQIAIPVFMIAFLYWIFEDDLQRLGRERELYRRELDSIVPFAEFGRNVTGVVHDFRNDASLFSSFTAVLRRSIGETVDQAMVDALDRSTRRFTGRIEMILAATTGGGQEADAEKHFDLRSIVEASVYVFRLHAELRDLVVVRGESSLEGTTIRGDARLLVAIMENVIRNSCDAILEKANRLVLEDAASWRPRVTIHCSPREIIISDNGPGLPFCPSRCRSNNCLYCPEITPGRTTKRDGNGIGLFRIRAAAEKLGVHVLVRTESGEGVTTHITIPSDVVVSES